MEVNMEELKNFLAEKTPAEAWKALLTPPAKYAFEHKTELVQVYKCNDFSAELYLQNNGPGTVQQVLKVVPAKLNSKAPAVVVPFYYPEAVLGFELDTLEEIPRFSPVAILNHLVQRGYIAITAEAYLLTYLQSDLDRLEWKRWRNAGEALTADYPQWSGVGKLVADTRLLVDELLNDARVDAGKIGIAGHSLGGKMAFYTGCMDECIKVILASDFGFNWNSTNWHDVWYWGDKLHVMQELNLEHHQLLDLAGGKPFMLLAGEADNAASYEAMQKSSVYKNHPEYLQIIDHATGHRPPQHVLEAGYDFLDMFLR
jgi:hypothetical protein